MLRFITSMALLPVRLCSHSACNTRPFLFTLDNTTTMKRGNCFLPCSLRSNPKTDRLDVAALANRHSVDFNDRTVHSLQAGRTKRSRLTILFLVRSLRHHLNSRRRRPRRFKKSTKRIDRTRLERRQEVMLVTRYPKVYVRGG